MQGYGWLSRKPHVRYLPCQVHYDGSNNPQNHPGIIVDRLKSLKSRASSLAKAFSLPEGSASTVFRTRKPTDPLHRPSFYASIEERSMNVQKIIRSRAQINNPTLHSIWTGRDFWEEPRLARWDGVERVTAWLWMVRQRSDVGFSMEGHSYY